ncbi:LOW QUALITY PROTEIN: putative G-protein coupled receptor 142 [Pterocles gutturalis]
MGQTCSAVEGDGPRVKSTAAAWASEGARLEPERSAWVVGIVPIECDSVLLGLPGEGLGQEGAASPWGLTITPLPPVNVLTVALSCLATGTKKSSYWYSHILTQVFIIFVGSSADQAVSSTFIHTVTTLEFKATHASIWVILLTVGRYVSLYPPRYPTISYPRRTCQIVAAAFTATLATGIAFYRWLEAWRDADPPTLDRVLKWVHGVTSCLLPGSIFLTTSSVIASCRGTGGQPDPPQQNRGLLLAVTAVFIMLWAPRTVVMMCHLYVASDRRGWRVHLALGIASLAALLSTSLSFFLCCFVSRTLRCTVGEVLQPAPAQPPAPQQPLPTPDPKPLGCWPPPAL